MAKDFAIDMGYFIRLAKTIKPPDFFHHLRETVFFNKVAFQEMTVVKCEFAGSGISIFQFYRQTFFKVKGFKKKFL
jgi:hypothetical protein